jgi:DNA polymerase III alpha subunit
MTDKEKLLRLLVVGMKEKGLTEDQYKERLKLELKEIDAQNEYAYFLSLHQRDIKYPRNENNLLVPYLLNVVEEFDINNDSTYIYGDWPDADVDYLQVVRDYIKNEWAPKEFGQEYVTNIGSYNTFGIKSALIDMARVFGKDRAEILSLTKKLGLKDEDGKVLSWEKALETFPALMEYCQNNKEVAEAAHKLLNRHRSMGKHAGGLIISSKPIHNFVPLVKGKDGSPVSAWVEGLHGQDLGPMGLVKFDLLVLTNLMQIALACKSIKERHGLSSICAKPNQKNWSDTAYLNDPLSLSVASKGDLKCVFQFDSDGIRVLAKRAGINCFNDLVSCTTIFRPGCLQMKVDEAFVKRKKGEEKYETHPLIEPYVRNTYGLLIFQEQIGQVLNKVGEVPLKDVEILRKAISKKNEKYFFPYKKNFIENGKKNLGWDEPQVEDLWKKIEAFSAYSFNQAHAVAYTYISSRLLWLKVHYPIEFYASILTCEDASEKIKEYKSEATKHGIVVSSLDLNKSGAKFQIVGGSIYIGFSNVKGIGEAAAEKIVAGQPYTSFKNFLDKFGTASAVVKPLLGLRIFGDNPIELYKYYEFYRKARKQKEDRKKRLDARLEELRKDAIELLPEELRIKGSGKDGLPDDDVILMIPEDKEFFMDDCKATPVNVRERVKLTKDKYYSAIANYEKKEEVPIPDFKNVDLKDIEIDDKVKQVLGMLEDAERQYYGFLWHHPIESSPDYDGGNTFENLRADESIIGYVEVQIATATKTLSKNKNTTYYLLKAEDANGEVAFIQVWADDWDRFSEELQPGAMVKIEVRVPDANFGTRYTLNGPPKWKRHLLPENKDYDFRVIKYRKSL